MTDAVKHAVYGCAVLSHFAICRDVKHNGLVAVSDDLLNLTLSVCGVAKRLAQLKACNAADGYILVVVTNAGAFL